MFSTLKGNSYYIPKAHSQKLHVSISEQTSRDQRGKPKSTSARYATAWLDHGVDPTDKDYEYTIIVNKPSNFVRVMEGGIIFNSPFFVKPTYEGGNKRGGGRAYDGSARSEGGGSSHLKPMTPFRSGLIALIWFII